MNNASSGRKVAVVSVLATLLAVGGLWRLATHRLGGPPQQPGSLSEALAQGKEQLTTQSKALDEKLRVWLPAYRDTLVKQAETVCTQLESETIKPDAREALQNELRTIARYTLALKKFEKSCKNTSVMIQFCLQRIEAVEGSSTVLEAEAKQALADILEVHKEATRLLQTQFKEDDLPQEGAIYDVEVHAMMLELAEVAQQARTKATAKDDDAAVALHQRALAIRSTSEIQDELKGVEDTKAKRDIPQVSSIPPSPVIQRTTPTPEPPTAKTCCPSCGRLVKFSTLLAPTEFTCPYCFAHNVRSDVPRQSSPTRGHALLHDRSTLNVHVNGTLTVVWSDGYVEVWADNNPRHYVLTPGSRMNFSNSNTIHAIPRSGGATTLYSEPKNR